MAKTSFSAILGTWTSVVFGGALGEATSPVFAGEKPPPQKSPAR